MFFIVVVVSSLLRGLVLFVRADYTAQGFHVIWRIRMELGWKPQEEEMRHLTINGRVTNDSLKVK